jgi:hypothetical protein
MSLSTKKIPKKEYMDLNLLIKQKTKILMEKIRQKTQAH